MLKKILATSAVIAVLPFFTTPSLALTGVQAAQKCLETPGCKVEWQGDGGSIITGPEGGQILCSELSLPCVPFRSTGAANTDPIGGQTSGKRTARDYVVPESLTSGGGNSGDTGVPGTGSGGGDPGPVTPVIQ